jgi:ubiquinone biosynthesis protein
MRVQMARQGKRLYRLRLGLILLALAMAWQPLSVWIELQDWPVLTAAAIGLLLLVWQ